MALGNHLKPFIPAITMSATPRLRSWFIIESQNVAPRWLRFMIAALIFLLYFEGLCQSLYLVERVKALVLR